MKETNTGTKNKCKKCGESVPFGTMKHHWLTKHPNEELPLHLKYQKKLQGVTCPECGERFSTPQAMTWHRKREHGVVIKKTKSSPVRRQAAEPSTGLCFCPRCGCDLEAVQVALNFKRI